MAPANRPLRSYQLINLIEHLERHKDKHQPFRLAYDHICQLVPLDDLKYVREIAKDYKVEENKQSNEKELPWPSSWFNTNQKPDYIGNWKPARSFDNSLRAIQSWIEDGKRSIPQSTENEDNEETNQDDVSQGDRSKDETSPENRAGPAPEGEAPAMERGIEESAPEGRSSAGNDNAPAKKTWEDGNFTAEQCAQQLSHSQDDSGQNRASDEDHHQPSRLGASSVQDNGERVSQACRDRDSTLDGAKPHFIHRLRPQSKAGRRFWRWLKTAYPEEAEQVRRKRKS